MNLEGLFKEMANTMRSEANKARYTIKHPGSKGTAFEGGFRKFTTDYLPKLLDVSTGSIVDSNGQQSNQIDIIVSDSAKTPVFYEREGHV